MNSIAPTTQSPPPDMIEETSLHDLVRMVRKHWWLVLAIATAATLGVAFYTLGQKRIFRSTVTLQLDPKPPSPLGQDVKTVVDMGAGAYWNNREYYETQFKIIKSRRVAKAAVERLGLEKDLAFVRNAPPGEVVVGEPPTTDAAVAALSSRLIVNPVEESRLVEVSFEDADPGRARRVLAALADAFIEQNVDVVLESTISAADWLQGQLGHLKDELEKNELALHDFKKDKQILSVSLDDQSNMLREEMSQLKHQLTEVRGRREALSARLKLLESIDPETPDVLPASELLNSSVLTSLRAEYLSAVKNRDRLLSLGKGPNYPDVVAAEADMKVSHDALLAEIRNIQGSAKRDLQATEAEAAGLAGLFASAKKEAFGLGLLEIQFRRLERAKDNTEKLYSLVLSRSKESDLTRLMRFNNIRVVDEATIPKGPIRPNVPVSIAIGAVVGLLLGFGTAFGRETLDRSIKYPLDLERSLGLPFLGVIPVGSGDRATGGSGPRRRHATGRKTNELLVHSDPTSQLAEAARALRTNIMFMKPDHPPKVLLVTSGAPLEGKTTVAVSLATALAQTGQRVVLVDGDLRRPRVHKVFGLQRQDGISNAVMDLNLLSQCIVDVGIPNLSVLGAGPQVPNPAELLNSEKFERLLARLREEYDRVVIDSSPIAAVTDAAIISTRVDGVVLVVRAFRTTRDLAKQAVKSLRDVGAPLLGGVLNCVRLDTGKYGYHYSYYEYGKQDGNAA